MAASDSLKFEKALLMVSPTLNSTELYKLLTFIRKNVEWPKHRRNIVKIHKSKCIKRIVSCLNSTHSNITAVSLSILGNCCLDSSCSNDMVQDGLKDLHHLVQKHTKDDGINGRVLRIIGNICRNYNAYKILLSNGQLVTYIMNFIKKFANEDESNFSEDTIVMAVRAVGKFLSIDSFEKLVETYGMLDAMGSLFIKCCDRWTSEKKDKAILDQLIKFLNTFSKYRYFQTIHQLRSTSKGNCLLYLSQVLPLGPGLIVSTVMNFSSCCRLTSELPIGEISEGFVTLLKEASSNKEEMTAQHMEYIRCLCTLFFDPGNRNRCYNSIPQLIRTFEEAQGFSSNTIEALILILETFERCQYHTVMLKQQLENNIIEVLSNKMEQLLGSRKYLKFKHNLVKLRKRNGEDSGEESPAMSDEDMEWHDASVAPSVRPSSPGSGSPTTSPWASPRRATPSPRASPPPGQSSSFYLHESDSEDYSPVCSENEEMETTERMSVQEDTDTYIKIEKISDSENVRSCLQNISEEDLKYKLIVLSLSLLKTYCTMDPQPVQISSDSVLMMLVKCACYFKPDSRASEIAKSVIFKTLSDTNSIRLLQTGMIYSLNSLLRTEHDSNECKKCFNFKDVAEELLYSFESLIESNKGQGDIAHILLCGTEEQKKQLSMVIPHLARSRKTIQALMIKSKGMKILAECLKDKKQRNRCLQGISKMVSRLVTDSPKQHTLGLTMEKLCIENYEVPSNCGNIVTFVLDDNSRLSADRDALCEKSSYFHTLLNGTFKESTEEFVKLQQTNYLSLKCLIYLIDCDLDFSQPRRFQLELLTLLDTITLCHRYLLDDLCLYLTFCVKQFYLTTENLPIIYKWSLESGLDILKLETVTYALRGDGDSVNRISCLLKLFDVGYTDVLIEDIETLISSDFLYNTEGSL